MIVHIDTAYNWRGGQQQVLLLHRALSESRVPSVVLTPDGSALARRCQRESLSVITLPRIPALAILSRRIYPVFKNALIIHAHNSGGATVAALACRLWPRAAVICHRRISYPKPPAFNRGWKYRRVRQWIAVSDEIAGQLKRAGVNAAKITTIASAIDYNSLRRQAADAVSAGIRDEFNISDRDIVLSSVGALVSQKNHAAVIRAAQLLHTSHPHFHLLIVGEGQLRRELEAEIVNRDLEGVVHLTGFRSDVAAILSLTDIVIAASRDGEGSPAAVKEAMCLNAALVASDIPAHRCIAGDNAVLTPPGDPAAIADAVGKLIDAPDKRQTLAARAGRATMRFSIDAMKRATLAVYQQERHV